MKAFLDTHAAVMLLNGDAFAAKSTDLLERCALFISPVVRLELAFLEEIGRITMSPDRILGGLSAEFGITQSTDPLHSVISHAMVLDWTRDPFDRLLVATAMLHGAPLVTRDQHILEHFPAAVW